MNLPKSEEQLMQHLWTLEKAFMKDLIDAYPEPKPAASTVATLLKRLYNRKAIGYKTFGSVRQYYPKISKEAYFSGQIKDVIQNFFNGSKLQFASFFTSETDLTEEELQALRRMVDEQIKSKKK